MSRADELLQQAYVDLFQEFEDNEDGVLVDAMQANPLFDVAEWTLLKLASRKLDTADTLLARWEWREAVRKAADLHATRRMADRAAAMDEDEATRAAELKRE